MLLRTVGLIASLVLTSTTFSCVKKNSSQGEVKGRTKSQYHVVATIHQATFGISDAWVKSVYKWIESRPNKDVPYEEPGFAKDLGWILAKPLKFSFNQLRDLGAASAPEISTYRTKCKVQSKENGMTKLVCDTSFDVYWDFDKPLKSQVDVWVMSERSPNADQNVFANFSKSCAKGSGTEFGIEEFYLYFDINKPTCAAKASPFFSKVTLQLAEGEKTNRQGIPDYQSAWSDQKLIGKYAFAREDLLPDANKNALKTHIDEFIPNLKKEAYTKPFYTTLDDADKSFIETIEKIASTKSFGPITTHKVVNVGHSLVVSLTSKSGGREIDSTFILGAQDNLLGDTNNNFQGSDLAPILLEKTKQDDFVFYGGHSTGGRVEALFAKTLVQASSHALLMIFGCETTSFVNHHLAYNDRALPQKPVIFANLSFPNFTEFPGQLSFLLRRYDAYPKTTSSWNEILGMFPMGSLMHETK